MLNPAIVLTAKGTHAGIANFENFWVRILRDEILNDCDDLQKLVVGCEIIAALDETDLRAA